MMSLTRDPPPHNSWVQCLSGMAESTQGAGILPEVGMSQLAEERRIDNRLWPIMLLKEQVRGKPALIPLSVA